MGEQPPAFILACLKFSAFGRFFLVYLIIFNLEQSKPRLARATVHTADLRCSEYLVAQYASQKINSAPFSSVQKVFINVQT
jgi:hypothetical protein